MHDIMYWHLCLILLLVCSLKPFSLWVAIHDTAHNKSADLTWMYWPVWQNYIFTNLCINSRRLASGCGQWFGNHATGPILPWVMYLCKMTKGDTVHTFVTICKGRQNSAKFKHDASPAWISSWKDLVLILCEHRDWTFNKKRHSYQLASDWKHSLCKHHLHHLFVTSRKTVPCMYPSEYWIGTLPDCHEQTNYWKDIPVLCPFPWSLRMDPMWFATKEHTPAQRRGGPVGVSGKGKGAKGLYFAYKNCMSQSTTKS